MTIDYTKLNNMLKKAIKEDIYDGHIDQEELSPEVFNALAQIGEQDEDGITIWAEDFQKLIEQLRTETEAQEEDESELISMIIEEIGADNYQMLLDEEINYITIHNQNDAEMQDIKEDPEQVEEPEEVFSEEKVEEAAERYLCVDPNPDDETHNAVLTLCQGNDDIDAIGFTLTDDMKDQDIREIAKGNFDNITDDIRVQWY